ncbi:MAG: BREX system P-loop protein [Candidatus Desulfovibrio kirbyi]|uniref:BREX system P-loop protein n=1 Tax=Candidatus Desulfovibrio kirbyi TaxID=2696086 RepID=A0A6L2R5M5_9BACT|nr:MAG: BREX system P-loop protein [Candidatus Desulfovibrio kirbyi]
MTTQIKELFDPAKDIYRTIEKVITYGASQEARLKAEITEYVATESIEEQFERLLTRMQEAMDSGGGNEVGVWVSGFYGSGKSSFTKYLGLALDESVKIEGQPFLKMLQDRFAKPQTRALLSALAARYPAAVVLLDLASDMLAGATMESVSNVLYYKVLQWAGYSKNLKVAALERKLRKDGRYAEFATRIQQEAGSPWKDLQNDSLVHDSLVPEIAHELYPQFFKTPTSFTTEPADIIQFETDRVREMLDIVREHTGKEFVVFIIDEVGQYIGSRPALIHNLDGLEKNLKEIGQGKAWIIGTAQQTLTEDDPRAALNSPELYKLKDRFPITVDLESNDIKEICWRRLLSKSSNGAQTLEVMFDSSGQSLRHNTKLHDARYYDSDFDKSSFVKLYPFLPAHFDILLHLLGALAKSTGGIGLRSAIKVIQDILVEGPEHQDPVGNKPVGWLATTVTIYDVLERDIRRAFPSIHKALGKVGIRFPGSAVHSDVAKTVAVLQILGNMPVSAQNVAGLMHPKVDAPSKRTEVDAAVTELIKDSLVPFGEKDGNLCFFNEKLNDIDKERAQIPIKSIETRRIINNALRETFSPLPSVRLHGTLTVTSGLKVTSGSNSTIALAGETHAVQSVVEFVEPQDYDAVKSRLIEESRQYSAQNIIYILARSSQELSEKTIEIYRCSEIVQRHSNDPDAEVKDYCAAQNDYSAKLNAELERQLKQCLSQGSFIFRGQATAADSIAPDVIDAAQKNLGMVAEQVFHRYNEAPGRVDTQVAEKFLRIGNLQAVNTSVDPLGLVQVVSGTPRINTAHKALVSIHDYIDRSGMVEGRRLSDYFTGAPFGWSPDTLRYLIAALLLAGEIKLKVSGREVTVNGQQVIEALRTNNSFKPIGVSLRSERPSIEVLAKAAERLTILAGDTVIPLEDAISKSAAKLFPKLQYQFGPLAERLKTLYLPGEDRIRALNQDLTDVLLTDASDAPQRLGGEESPLYESLKWATEADRALKNGLEHTVRELQEHRHGIEALPSTGVPGKLRQDLSDELAQVNERLGSDNFFVHQADLNTALTAVMSAVRDAAIAMTLNQRKEIQEAARTISRMPEWSGLNEAEQSGVLGKIDSIAIDNAEDLAGIKKLLNQAYDIRSELDAIRDGIVKIANERRIDRKEATRPENNETDGTKRTRSLKIPATISSAAELEALIRSLQEIKTELAAYSVIEVAITIEK